MNLKKIAITLSIANILTLFTGTLSTSATEIYKQDSSNVSYEESISSLKLIDESTNYENLDLNEKEILMNSIQEVFSDYTESDSYNISNANVILNIISDMQKKLYNIEFEKGNSTFGSNSTETISNSEVSTFSNDMTRGIGGLNWSNRKGNVLISRTAKTYGYPHGHAAILSDRVGMVIEALPSPGVIEQSGSKYWSTVSDEREVYYRGASWSNYNGAIKYARNQIGEPYKLKTSMSDTSQWYCSKLVYNAFKSTGFNITGKYHIAILPADLWSYKTVQMYHNSF